MLKDHKFAFPDTMIFLHFQFFTEIAWNKLLQTKSVTLVIPPIIPTELDKHKRNHPSERVRDRATKVTKKLAEILRFNTEVRPKVNLQFERIEPTNEFEKYNLSKDAQDDHLLASIFLFQEKTGNKAVLITDDTPLLLKAHLLNIEVFELPEEYRIKIENTDKKKIAELEKELNELKVRIPRLKIVSIDNDKIIKSQKLSIISFSEEDTLGEIELIKNKYPLITETYKPKRQIKIIGAENLYLRTEGKVEFELPSGETKLAYLSSIEKYNRELEKFYTDYESYVKNKVRVNNLRGRAVKLQVKLKNEGNVPAERVHVFLTFPEKFIITTDEDVFSYPSEIKPPQLDNREDFLSGSLYGTQLLADYYSLKKPSFQKMEMIWEQVTIKEKDSVYTASFQNLKLSHGYSLDCPEIIYVIFPKNHTVKPFQINYEIRADNLPKSIVGKLNVFVNEHKKDDFQS